MLPFDNPPQKKTNHSALVKKLLRERFRSHYDAVRRGTQTRAEQPSSPFIQQRIEEALRAVRKRIYKR